MYEARMSLRRPGCVLFLVDQSLSMDKRMPGRVRKSEAVADAVNRLLSGLVGRCTEGDTTHDYLHVGVLGYAETVMPLLTGARPLLPISEVAGTGRPGFLVPGPRDGLGRLVKVKPWPLHVYIEPRAVPYTAMCSALLTAIQVVGGFIRAHPDSFPPIVINLTDGDATDGEPGPLARTLCSLASRDGNVLLFNLHMSTRDDPPLEYPAALPRIRDPYAERLFAMSSVLPPRMVEAAAAIHRHLDPGARGFAYNARMENLSRFLDIGVPPLLLPSRRP
jgi:hypothetical protein